MKDFLTINKNEYKLEIYPTSCDIMNVKILNNKLKPTTILCKVPQTDFIDSKCKFLNNCGNCSLLKITYNTQLKLKQQIIQELFKPFKIKVNNITGLYYPYKYRNKVHLSIASQKGKTVIGFIKEGSSEVTEIPNCLMHEKWFQILYSELKNYISHSKIQAYNKHTHQGELRYAVARCLDNNLMLTLVTTKSIYNGLKQFYNALSKYFNNVSLYININSTKTSAVFSNNFIHKFGTKTLQGNMCGINFELSPKSFLQINTTIATKIYNKVSEILNLKQGNNIIDCFSGIGLSSLIFAKAGATVESIELEKNACKDAINLAKNNNLSEKINVNCGDCNLLLPQISNNFKDASMFADPPRAGLGDEFIQTMISSNIKKFVYLSCNPLTLINDLNKLTIKYNIKEVIPFDMFPHTKHIETLVILERK